MKKLLELYLPINFSETFRSLNTEEIPLIAVVKEPDLLCAFISLFSLENYDTFFFADFARKSIVIRELPVRFMTHFFFLRLIDSRLRNRNETSRIERNDSSNSGIAQ